MPTYEYECTACGQHMEVFQRFSEDALTTCGVCGGVLLAGHDEPLRAQRQHLLLRAAGVTEDRDASAHRGGIADRQRSDAAGADDGHP